MALKVTNNAISTLAGAIASGDTSLSVASGDASKFPTLGAGDWFPLTIVDASGNLEIVKVTARSGAVLTVVRGQEGTAARSFAAGSRCDIRQTAAVFDAKLDSSQLDTDGALAANSDTKIASQKAIKTYVDGTAASKLDKSGGSVSGDIDMTGHQIKNAGDAGKVDFFAIRSAPTGWLKANGAAVSRTTYAALFAALVTNENFTSQNFTVTVAAPGVVTKTAHGFVGGERLRLSTTGALPTGLNTTADFFVIFVDANTFRLATSQDNAIAGTAVTTTGTQSGTHSYMQSLWGLGDGSTTFNLPDLRSEFIRGLDDGRGVDTNRTMGSAQRSQNLAHAHGVTDPTHVHGVGDPGHSHPVIGSSGTATFASGLVSANKGNVNDVNGTAAAVGTGIWIGGAATGISIQSAGGAEARPRNAALLACIKY